MATIRYTLSYDPHPWDDKRREKGVEAWCLVRLMSDENGIVFDRKVVAMFNLDSDAELLMQAVFEGSKIDLPSDWVEILTQRKKRRAP